MKRTAKAWILITKRGAKTADALYCDTVKRHVEVHQGDDERVVPCVITWDDGKPVARPTAPRGIGDD